MNKKLSINSLVRYFILSSNLLLLTFFAIVISSCAKEDTTILNHSDLDRVNEKIEGNWATITLGAEYGDANDDTKTVLSGNDLRQVYWSPGDKINVFYNRISNLFVSTNTEPSPYSDFVGTIEGITDPTQLEGKTVIGVYPYNNITGVTASNYVTTFLPSLQTAVENSFADSLFISLSKSTTDATKMRFYNFCSGLCFSVSHDDIKSVTLRGANDEPIAGTIQIKFDNIDGKEIPVLRTISTGHKLITLQAPNGGNFIPGKKYYIVTIPQEFPDGIIIEGFKEDGTVYQTTIDRSVTLKRSVFARKLEFDSGKEAEDLYDYVLTVTRPTTQITYSGVNWPGGLSITSYKSLKSDSSKQYPVAWKMQITQDEGATWQDFNEANKDSFGADWLQLGAYYALPTTTTVNRYSINVDVAPGRTIIIEDMHTDSLYNGSHKSGIINSTKSNAIDLSRFDLEGNYISQTTANCYVVPAPGWYKFPMVYGNAIKNGITNTNSFVSTATPSANILSNFIDHAGNPVTQPWVTNVHSGGAYNVTKSEIVWQDEQDLITNVSIGNGGADNDYIYFYVGQSTIHQGNAVIAAYNEGEVLWSWHIWVTDTDFSTPDVVTNYSGIVYEFLPVNIGESAYGTDYNYDGREVQLRIQQIGSALTSDCPIVQKENKLYRYTGNNTFYQWGRKDPIPPIPSGGYKKYYDKNGNPSTSYSRSNLNTLGAGNNSISQMIKNPKDINLAKVADNSYINLWSANETSTLANDNIVVKTIYDPSPIGYCVPSSKAWTGFSETGTNSFSPRLAREVLESGYGWFLYSDRTDQKEVFYPYSRFIGQSTSLSATELNIDYSSAVSFYWSAHAKYNYSAWLFNYYISGQRINPLCGGSGGLDYGYNYKGYCCSVRPVKEK